MRFDTDEGTAPLLSLAQVARYRATSCVDMMASDPQLGISQDKISEWKKVLGPSWANRAQSSQAQGKTLPDPTPITKANNLQESLANGEKCVLHLRQDAYYLAKIVTKEKTNSFAPEIYSGSVAELQDLIKTFFAVASGMEISLLATAQSAQTQVPFSPVEPSLPLRYTGTSWENLPQTELEKIDLPPLTNSEPAATRQSTPDKNNPGKSDPDPSDEQKEKLNEIILKIDALRFSLESHFASNPDLTLKQLVANKLSPLMRRQSQKLVALLGSDPRQVRYEKVNPEAKNYLEDALKLYQNLQYELLLASPDPEKIELTQTMTQLSQTWLNMGIDPGATPGIELGEAKVKS